MRGHCNKPPITALSLVALAAFFLVEPSYAAQLSTHSHALAHASHTNRYLLYQSIDSRIREVNEDVGARLDWIQATIGFFGAGVAGVFGIGFLTLSRWIRQSVNAAIAQQMVSVQEKLQARLTDYTTEADQHLKGLFNYLELTARGLNAYAAGDIRGAYDAFSLACRQQGMQSNTTLSYLAIFADKLGQTDEAGSLYKKLMAAKPPAVVDVVNYGFFLYSEKESAAIEDIYQHAIDEQGRSPSPSYEQDRATLEGNLECMRLLICAQDKLGLQQLRLSRVLADGRGDKRMLLEVAFCHYLYFGDDGACTVRKHLKSLLQSGVHSTFWNFRAHLDRSLALGIPGHRDFLERLAQVITGKDDLSQLDSYPDWQNIA